MKKVIATIAIAITLTLGTASLAKADDGGNGGIIIAGRAEGGNGGIIIAGRAESGNGGIIIAGNSDEGNGGIIIAGFTGIIIAGLQSTGIIIAG